MKVYLDGNPVQVPNNTLLNPTFTIRREDEEGKKVISFTGDMEFTGSDAAYLKQQLVTHANAVNNFVVLKFVDDCCDPNLTYEFKIVPSSLEWCEGNCEITAAAVEHSTTATQYACLKSTLIWDNYNNFQSQTHPKITYCVEMRPSGLQDVIIILGIIINLILILLSPVVFVIMIIIAVINAIIAAVNTLPGVAIDEIDFDGDSSTNTLQEYQNFINLLNQYIIGCGRKHPSPLVRSYAENVCGKCGLTFQSSIFNQANGGQWNGRYYNTVYFNAPVKKGNDFNNNSNWIDENKPLLNGNLFFDQLKKHFNGKWRIVNNVLIFERRDYFFNTGTPWLDLTTLPDEKINRICYSWSKFERYAYGNFQYAKDGFDWVGDEALDRWNDIVEWNSPYSPTQKDEFLFMSEFAAARFRDDGVERDVLSAYKNAPFVGSFIQQYDNVMLMNNGTSFQPKLLIWDPNTGFNNSKVDPTCCASGIGGVGLNQHYCYPLWINANYSGNLYEFWEIDNPRHPNFPKFDFVAEIVFDCDILAVADIDKTINTSEGLAKELHAIEINHETKLMTITGNV